MNLKEKLRMLDRQLHDWDHYFKKRPDIFIELTKLDEKRKQVRQKLKEYKVCR